MAKKTKEEKAAPAAIVAPPITSLAELDQALAAMGRMDATEAEINAQAAQAAAEIIKQNESRLFVDVAGVPVAFADYRAALETAAEKFCAANRANIVEAGRKSRELNHGKFGWRGTKEGLLPLADFDEKGNPELLEELLGSLREKLASENDTLDFTRYVDIKLAWSKSELLSDFQKRIIQPRTLARTGFTLKPKGEEFFAEPKVESIESQPTQ